MRFTTPVLLILAGLVYSSAPVEAQREISGVLFDSLRLGQSVAGGDVVLIGARRRAAVDADGRFYLSGISNGADTVAYWAPWLDSLGLPPLRAPVAAGSSGHIAITLTTPSFATYAEARCGTALEAGEAILIGEATDSDGNPGAGVVVVARWTETTIGSGMLSEQLIATVDTTSATGSFTLCGVPHEAVVSFRAIDPALSSDEISLTIRDRVQRQNLLVGSGSVVSQIHGQIVGENGEAVSGASLFLGSSEAAVAVSDSSGRFIARNVPRRTAQLIVRAIGYLPQYIAIAPSLSQVDIPRIVLLNIPPELERVTVTAEDMFSHERRGFEERSRLGMGDFITEDMLKNIPVVTPNVLSSMSHRVRVQQGVKLRYGAGGICSPRFFIDGIDHGTLTAELLKDQERFIQLAKRIEVYTAALSPPKFNDFDGCGVVVIWLR